MRERPLALALGASAAFHAFVLSLSFAPVADEPIAPASMVVVRLTEPRVETLRKVQRKVLPAPVPAQPELPPATTVGQYRYLLAAAAARHNAYPGGANGVEGDAVVRVGVGATGSVKDVTVARSSGHPVLDEQALEVFARAAREVPVPQALWGREFGVELAASYRAEALR